MDFRFGLKKLKIKYLKGNKMERINIRFVNMKNIFEYDFKNINKVILKSGKIKINNREYNYEIVNYSNNISFIIKSFRNFPLLTIDLYIDGSIYVFANKRYFKSIYPFLDFKGVYQQLKSYYNKIYNTTPLS
jgi:hypothetical protein